MRPAGGRLGLYYLVISPLLPLSYHLYIMIKYFNADEIIHGKYTIKSGNIFKALKYIYGSTDDEVVCVVRWWRGVVAGRGVAGRGRGLVVWWGVELVAATTRTIHQGRRRRRRRRRRRKRRAGLLLAAP